MAASLPNFNIMATGYKGDGWTADMVKKVAGRSLMDPKIDDTCIVRISDPLNNAGGVHKIPSITVPFRTRIGKNGNWYGLRVKEFWVYMVNKYGPPSLHLKGSAIDRDAFESRKGIAGFLVKFHGGSANGHFTLWDGSRLLYSGERDYFSISHEAALWEAPS
ncbi:MAG: hypothetical protein H0V76_04805 [Blastocatellia bacterium]|nr:hypothetical protein [Blastocatellia bacterium]